ncbi:hypothetical protein WH91_12260 [Devosia psychrophila]|uniref:Uncharacterized protein n=1 Tax=Devosia psychrophila TaxID=728005 RepID=A0ABR5DX62_9HYPH|nr:hypothetical protein WH91_12260 [Devosia psychrophila]
MHDLAMIEFFLAAMFDDDRLTIGSTAIGKASATEISAELDFGLQHACACAIGQFDPPRWHNRGGPRFRSRPQHRHTIQARSPASRYWAGSMGRDARSSGDDLVADHLREGIKHTAAHMLDITEQLLRRPDTASTYSTKLELRLRQILFCEERTKPCIERHKPA